jgi:glycosyltransferase involved in cell wall biosynthesis
LIRLVHLVPYLGVGGTEAVLLDLCRHRDRTAFDCTVATFGEWSPLIADELRAEGIRVATGVEACRRAVHGADLVNLHWWSYSPSLLNLARQRPFVTTLHCQAVLPRIPGLTICTSEEQRKRQLHPERFLVIPNGVDVERFRPRERPAGERLVITRVCRPTRCALYFWDAIHHLLARYPHLEVRIAGNSEVARHPSPRVRFLGVRRDIPEILAESDVFLYTPPPGPGTKDLVVMEASAAGVPCVVSDVNAVRESVEEGRNGFLTPFGDVEALVERVARLIDHPELRAEMSRSAAEMAREQFDVRRNAARYEAVYRGILSGQRRWAAGAEAMQSIRSH